MSQCDELRSPVSLGRMRFEAVCSFLLTFRHFGAGAGVVGGSFAAAWQAALTAAEKGLEATKQMKAVHGRAAYRGENSIGTVDPGATVGVMLVRAVVAAVR